jgi:hypothetical protein
MADGSTPKNDERKYASDENGNPLYVQTKTQFGRSWEHLYSAINLTDAKRRFGWTRENYTTVRVRRATPADVERLAGGSRV